MLHPHGCARTSILALAMLAVALPLAGGVVRADETPQPTPVASEQPSSEPMPEPSPPAKDSKAWSILPSGDEKDKDSDSDDHIVRFDQPPPSGEPMGEGFDDAWTWQWVPTGLIYHSYLAGPKEPRAGITGFSDGDSGAFADATLGGRMGFVRFGDTDPVHPCGWQVDFYGAAIARLDLKSKEDLDACDYVFGLPITYGDERLQFKFGYAHLSSHLGDEFMVSHPGFERVNYVRDSLVFGTSYFPIPAWRVYGEAGLAFHHDGGAGLWETQFGTELSKPGPTGNHVTPFFACNGRVRDDEEIGGDVNIQAGWLWRGILGQTLRYGLDYYNGKSVQSQFFNNNEQQYGLGLWYDF